MFVGLLLSALLIACSGSSNSSATPTSAPAATAVPTSAAAVTVGPTATKAAVTPTTAAAAIAGSSASAASTTIKVANDSSLGQILTDSQGLTLYTFKNDVAGSGKSSVSATLAKNWPPLTLASGSPVGPSGATGALALITRDDGSMQVTYKGVPLYRYIGDAAPGDTKGQGLGGVWFVATP